MSCSDNLTNISLKKILVASAITLAGSAYGVTNSPSPEPENPAAAIKGRVVDDKKQTLPGASIYIEELKTGVCSDVNGYYLLPNMKEGVYTLKVSYVGYDTQEIKVSIPSKGTVEKDLCLEEGLTLNEVVVGGAFQGHVKAINSQKNSLGVVNVVSSDQTAKYPDSNIGDALKRISGINVQYDQGEARFGQVRGTAADLSSVSINGNRVPSAEGETRTVQLDLIPSEMIQMIEVNKVVTPDMDGDAIGGSINLVTKNSPYKQTISASLGTGYSFISEEPTVNAAFTYGNSFFDRKLGVIVAASYENNPSGSDNVEFVWDKDDDGKAFVSEYQIRQYYVQRERQSYSAALNWELNTNNRIDFKGIYNTRNDWENRYRLSLKDLDESGKGTVRIQTKGGTANNKNRRLEKQQTMDYTLGGEHLWGIVEFDWKASYAKATEERPNERYIDFQLKKQQFTPDLSDERKPYMEAVDQSSVTLSDKFSLKEVTESFKNVSEEDKKFSFNATVPLNSGYLSNSIKLGAKMVSKTKDMNKELYEYSPIDKDGFMSEAFANTADMTRDGYYAGSKYKAGSFVTNTHLGSLKLDDSSLFEKELVQEELATNYSAKETVTAGYLRFDQKVGKKWDLMAGVRLENTHVSYTGMQYDDEEDIATATDKTSKSYMNILPSVLVKYKPNDDLVVRAAYTNTLARPKYSDLVPRVIVEREDNRLTLGNPDLNPTISYNYDLSADYYFKGIGMITAGFYYKGIKDFIVDQRIQNYVHTDGKEYSLLTQPKNAGNADLWGLEFSYQRDFGFIAPCLKYVGFYGTYTYTHSKVNNFNFEGRENESDLKMPGSPEHTANASLYFERKGINIRVSYNYASEFIDEVGESKFYDRYYDAVSYLDVNASYTFGKNYTIYASAGNLLNQPLRYYQGDKSKTMQAEYYGIRLNAGFKVTF